MTNIPFTNPGLYTPNHRACPMQMQASSINDVNLLGLAIEVGYRKQKVGQEDAVPLGRHRNACENTLGTLYFVIMRKLLVFGTENI